MKRICLVLIAMLAMIVSTSLCTQHVNADPVASTTSLINLDEDALSRFKAYLAVNTSHPSPNYKLAVDFLVQLAQDLSFPYQVVQLPSGLQVVVLTYKNLLEDSSSNTESIMLNSHTDVVPADPAKWNSDPFTPMTTEDGKIFARGSQDMKSVGMQYVEAVYRMKLQNVKLKYTLRIVFVPEEEVGGAKGMKEFLETKEFKEMNVVFSFDEGIPVADANTLKIYYGENAAWWFKVTCDGNVGHGSQFIKNTASSQLNKYVQRAFEFRNQQEQLINLLQNAEDESDVVTINMNSLSGGIPTSVNVIPRQVSAYFDSRIPPHYDLEQMNNLYTNVLAQDTNCKITWIQQPMENPISDLNNSIIQKTIAFFKERYPTVKLRYFPAATDARFVRGKNIPCLGISLLSGVPMLLHDHNEFITEEIFLNGIKQYQELFTAL